MPDEKKTASRGIVNFEAVKVGEQTLADENIKQLSCAPPPSGTKTRFNPELTVAPRIDPLFLQQSEIRRLQTASKTAAETAEPSMATILDDLANAMAFKTFPIDLKRLPADWDNVLPCFDVTIASTVICNVWEITAKATSLFTSGGETFPAGDSIATFRLWVPREQRFVRRAKWNSACCPVPGQAHWDQFTDPWWPDKWEYFMPPEGWKFEYKPKLEYQWYYEPTPEEPR